MKIEKKILLGEALIAYKKNLKLNRIQREVLIGTLLGDATMIKQKTNSYNIKFEQSLAKKEYILHLYELFIDFVGMIPKERIIKKNEIRKSIWFRTYRHISFLFYYNIFYNGGKKKVPKFLHKYFSRRSLAYWFMDDGSKEKYGYKISTHSFNLLNQKILLKILNSYKLDARVYKDRSYYFIFIKNIIQFNKIVLPFILPCMMYKIHNKKD